MKIIDLSKNRLVRCGRPWPAGDLPPTKQLALSLERNEALISWLQPRDGGLQDQFPAIKVGDRFFSLSMRIMKSVWRHVRLRKGFVNRQLVPCVGETLRIPHALLLEKLRTQQRFNVRGTLYSIQNYICVTCVRAQTMRSKCHNKAHGAAASQQTLPCATSPKCKDMLWVVRHLVLTAPEPSGPTRFDLDEHEVCADLLAQMKANCPRLFNQYDLARVLEQVQAP